MKIGIMSMQRIINYGSFLQSYSLKKNIEMLGCDVEFVDYVVEPCIKISEQADKSQRHKKDIFGAIRRRLGIYNKKEKLFLARKQFKIRYDNEFLKMLQISDKRNYTPELDVLIIGSDEVFNCLQQNPDVGYSLQLFGKDNRAKRLITYAASFGNTTIEKMNRYGISDEIKELMKDFNTISVRDNNSKDIVMNLLSTEPIMHLDPVFIYDYPETEKYNIEMKDYIVLYAYTNRFKADEAEGIKALAKKMNKKIVCLGEYQDFCDEYIPADPFEMLAYIKAADYVITDTFHGCVFSIKLNKQFAVITRSSSGGNYGNEEKLTSLLGQFGLQSRIITDLTTIEDVLLAPIDYDNVNKKIEAEKNRSIDYLDKEFCKIKGAYK